MNMNIRLFGIIFCFIATATGCALPPPMPSVEPNFVFTPPSSVSATHSKMAIAILQPVYGGDLFADPLFSNVKTTFDEMLKAAHSDIEKILIARGFTTAGAYPTIDEMTYSQKQRASLILRSTFNLEISVNSSGGFSPSTATMRGSVSLDFLEPMSREKVWLKRLELAPITKTVKIDTVMVGQKPLELQPGQKKISLADLVGVNRGGQVVQVIAKNSMNDLLNTFYASALEKIWNQLDAREIKSLKQDADKLKHTTQYRGG